MGGGKNGGRGGAGGFFGMAKANVTSVDKNAKDKVSVSTVVIAVEGAGPRCRRVSKKESWHTVMLCSGATALFRTMWWTWRGCVGRNQP
jgi:hypothetical protein